MSVYVVSNKLINAIVTFVADGQARDVPGLYHALEIDPAVGDLSQEFRPYWVGLHLYKMNVDAYIERYPQDAGKEFRPYMGFERIPCTLGEAYSHIRTYLYQTCESVTATADPMYKYLDKLSDTLAHALAAQHPTVANCRRL